MFTVSAAPPLRRPVEDFRRISLPETDSTRPTVSRAAVLMKIWVFAVTSREPVPSMTTALRFWMSSLVI